MFSFFKRKSRPNNNNNNENKTSVNMQLAIEKQQANLHRNLELKRQNDVNDRSQKDVNSLVTRTGNNEDDPSKNKTAVLPLILNEYDKSKVLTQSTCADVKQQNYDQYRDAKRTAYMLSISNEHASKPEKTPTNCYQPNAKIVVASSIKDQQNTSPLIGTDSRNTYNSVYEVMGRGRNRNKNRGYSTPNNYQNYNKNVKSVIENEDEKNLKQLNDVTSENSNLKQKNIEEKHNSVTFVANGTAFADENSEKSASISYDENVFHDENSCSKNNQPENQNDNLATSDEATNIVVSNSHHHDEEQEEEEKEKVKLVESSVKNEEFLMQQVEVPLQRNPSLKRVTFAPSPPRSVASSDDEDETISDDIFYEAEAPNETQKLRILSTITSHSCESSRIEEENEEIGTSASNDEMSSSNSNNGNCNSSKNMNNDNKNNDIVCAKIILSVDENDENILSDNDEGKSDNIKTHAFSSDESNTNITNDFEVTPKTIKPSYLLVGEDTIALPDIVAETSLLEQQQHLPVDEMATLGSQASNYNGNSISSSQIEVVDQMQLKVNQLCMKIDDLERELDIKIGAVERLQSELEANSKEDECVRQRLRFQDEQLEKVKERQDLLLDEEQRKYASLDNQHKETIAKLHKMQSLASSLNLQLAQASTEMEKLRQARDEILDKLTAQEKILRDILQTAMEEREQIVAKWKHDFEQLRNVNCDREEHLMEDCEWKLRQMMKQCKEKIERAESEKKCLKDQAQVDKETIKSQRDEIRNLKGCEREAAHLRSLTDEQKSSLSSMLRRVDDLKSELSNVKRRLQDEIDSCLQIKRDCAYQLSEKERSCLSRIEIARGESAMEWEDRLMEEMCRLTRELEQVHLDERNSALNKLKAEQLLEIQAITANFKQQEKILVNDIAALKVEIETKQKDLQETQSKADMQLLDHRAYLQKRERDHQKELDKLQVELERQQRLHSDLIEEIKDEHKREKEQIKASFYRSLEQIKEEFANEITLTTETLQAKHKKEMEEQWKQLVHEKETALLTAENRHRIRIEDADNKLSAIKLNHKRELSDFKDQFEFEKIRLNSRDVSNTQEIDTLHRKCICLTKLFEEMRMRYERRDPRSEDLRQIDELKSVVESQEKDIFHLTEQLREMQLQQHSQQHNQHSQQNQGNLQNVNQSRRNKNKNNKNSNNHRNNNNTANHNGNSNNNIINNGNNIPQQTQQQQQQMRHDASLSHHQTQQNANHDQHQHQSQQQQQVRMKPPPLIKTIIYEEENENELYEQQIREERENAQKIHEQEVETELQSHGDSVTVVELVPESPDFTTKIKQMNLEEISEAHIISNLNHIPDVVVFPTTTLEDKLQEIRVEVISTIEPSNIQIVPVNRRECNGNASTYELELD
ncbi:CLUMA_CG005189, isoform B [Clunio marinus]|uniref:CLUMA_CG005189, isoform B n=1 Tax=Clunio marinus TaxID=568069 RepID=A0A1J1HVE9_9DIPT|nr:CLUMA_CG005189, isoform B [Clunio marinus]